MQATTAESPGPTFPLQGKASNVGVRGDKGQIKIDTTLVGTGSIDLSVARLVLDQVLMESDRAGELVRSTGGSPILPLARTAARGNKPRRATFKTPAGARPIISVEVTNRDAKSGSLEVSVTVDGAAVPQTAEGCDADGRTLLRTRFVLDDHVHARLTFMVEQPWTCKKSKLTTP